MFESIVNIKGKKHSPNKIEWLHIQERWKSASLEVVKCTFSTEMLLNFAYKIFDTFSFFYFEV